MKWMKYWIFMVLLAALSCKKETSLKLRYFEVGVNYTPDDWRDSSFVIATSDPALLIQVEEQLRLPVAQRSHVNGSILAGDGGYNKNASHSFSWHFDETDWRLVNVSVEIYDGRAYTDIDKNNTYWFNTVKRFAPWGSYVKREITE